MNKKVVIYSHQASDKRWEKFKEFGVQVSTHAIPSHFKIEGNTTAVFTTLAQPDNLYHFWHDMFKYVYATIGLTEKQTSQKRRLLFWLPLNQLIPGLACCNLRKYGLLFRGLEFDRRMSYLSVPSETCFRHAVFGQANPTIDEQIDAVDNVRKAFNINRTKCVPNQVLIIRRRNRNILNIEELKTTAINMGYSNTKIIRFETLPVVRQLYEVSCARVLIGVQGQGLAWSMFMPPGALVIEISWPDKYWPMFYNNIALDYGHIFRPIHVTDDNVHENITKRNLIVHRKGELWVSQHLTVIGRLADVTVDTKVLGHILQNYSTIHSIT